MRADTKPRAPAQQARPKRLPDDPLGLGGPSVGLGRLPGSRAGLQPRTTAARGRQGQDRRAQDKTFREGPTLEPSPHPHP